MKVYFWLDGFNQVTKTVLEIQNKLVKIHQREQIKFHLYSDHWIPV